MREPIGSLLGLTSNSGIVGPWQCEQCGNLSQFADIHKGINRIFCKNENCRYERIVDKRHRRIIENDGTAWEFDLDGNKRRITRP